MKNEMTYKQKSGIYRNYNGNCTFDPKTFVGLSYNWWLFVSQIDGKVIFNNYSYSVTTSSHQSSMRSLLNDLGIKIDLFIQSPKGLQDLQSAYDCSLVRLHEAQRKQPKARSLYMQKAWNEQYQESLLALDFLKKQGVKTWNEIEAA